MVQHKKITFPMLTLTILCNIYIFLIYMSIFISQKNEKKIYKNVIQNSKLSRIPYMYSLPPELYSKIFDHVLKLSNKINLTFTNKIFFDMFKKELRTCINEFNKLHVPNKKKYSYKEKIIFRCCYDGY